MKAKSIPIAWNQQMSVYASEGYLKSVGDAYGWIGGIDQQGILRCILPYTIIRKTAIRMARFRVETISIGSDLDPVEERVFLEDVVRCLRGLGADLIIPAATNAIFRTHPSGAIAAPYGTLVIDLTASEEQLWANLHPKHRNVIRRARKEGVTIHSGVEYANIAYGLVHDTLRRSGIPFMSRAAFDRMLEGLGENVRVMVAEYRGVIQGSAIIPFSQNSAYYAYGGTLAPRPVTGALNLLQWEAIVGFQRLGVKRYDFCGTRINPDQGSKQAGLYMFKERFGAHLEQGYMWKTYINPMRSVPYRIGVSLLRGGDIVDRERARMCRSGEAPHQPEGAVQECSENEAVGN